MVAGTSQIFMNYRLHGIQSISALSLQERIYVSGLDINLENSLSNLPGNSSGINDHPTTYTTYCGSRAIFHDNHSFCG
jgi:hypothetical protein